MIVIEDGKGELAKAAKGTLSRKNASVSVADLERAMLKRFPREDAEPWDRMGLLVGDGAAMVEGVAVALDPTIEAIGECARLGANVLVTHHPLFLDPPVKFSPYASAGDMAGTCVWEAVSKGIAVMNFHTSFDVSEAGGAVLPSMLGLVSQGVFDPLSGNPAKGYGRVCQPSSVDERLTVNQLAARCTSVFGRLPRVWSLDESKRVGKIVTATGSAGDMAKECVKRGVDVLICGEVKYHAALDARNAGLSIIELGHDVSELPLCAPLMAAVESAGIPESKIYMLDQSFNWATPDAVRL